MLIYDCEIKKAILKKGETSIQGIEYCDGWHDFENMGISCICAYDYATKRYRVFLDDNLHKFSEFVDQHEVVIGYNNIAFDNKLCRANGILIHDGGSIDLLVEIWKAAGLGPEFEYPTHLGFGLDAVCRMNFFTGKTDYAINAPVQYQRGKIGELVDYCLNDAALTKAVMDKLIFTGYILDPRNGNELKIDMGALLDTMPNFP